MKTLEPSTVPADELGQLDKVVENLPADSSLRGTLAEVAGAVHSGQAVIVNGDPMLTPAQAAKLLNMSRTHLYKILDANELRWKQIGRDRRIMMSDLVEFLRGWDKAHEQMAARFGNPETTREAARKVLFG